MMMSESGTYDTVPSDGRTVKSDVAVPAIIPLDTWDIVVEDWNAGERVVNTEEKFGHTTNEVYYLTKKEPLTFENSALVPWKDLPASADQLATITGTMAHVSGVGLYETEFELPATWKSDNGALLRLGSTNGTSAQVWVNGQKANGIDLRSLTVDITSLLKTGRNTVTVVVPSTLTNRLIQRDYGSKTLFGFFKFWSVTPAVQSYGLTGTVEIVPYTKVTVR
jgi:hypothetical protein